MPSVPDDEPYLLNLKVPFDLRREDDARFVREIEALPNGLKTGLLRFLLIHALPIDLASIDRVVADAFQDLKKRGKQRGRPKGRIQGEQVARLAQTELNKKQKDGAVPLGAVVAQPKEQVSPVIESRLEPILGADSNDAATAGDDLSQYAGMLGTTTWN